MTQVDLRPLTLGEILDRTFTMYRRHFPLWVGITAVPQVLALAVELARNFFAGPNAANLNLGFSIAAPLFAIVVLFVAVSACLFAQAATFLAVSYFYLTRPVSVSDCLRRAWREIGTVFGVAI